MHDSSLLLSHIQFVHNTTMGIEKIKKNLKLTHEDVVEYCKNKILDKNCIEMVARV